MMKMPPRRTKPRYPWRDVAVGERFVVAVRTKQLAMEQCSRATKRYARQKLRFAVIGEFPPHGWLVERIPWPTGRIASPKRTGRRRDPLAHLYEVDRPEPWETE